MRIPLLDLKAQYTSLRDELDQALLRTVEQQGFILGPEVEAFEHELAEYVGADHAVGVSSCSDALFVALSALGVGAGDEVITPAYSFFATAEAILRCGARPVFVDIKAEDFQIDCDQALQQIGARTKALLVVHLFGRCSDTARLASGAAETPIVEDAAQAIGATLDGRHAGALGRLGCFSFFPSKNLGGYGDGGMVTTSDQPLADDVRALRIHGQPRGRRHEHTMIGGNYRLDALQAAILRVKLRHLEDWTAKRRAHARQYRELFAASAPDVTLPPLDGERRRDVFNQFVIRVPGDRDGLRAHLAEHGIGSGIYYPRPQHLQPCVGTLGYREGDFPNAEHAARRNVALPVYPELGESAISEIVETIASYVRR